MGRDESAILNIDKPSGWTSHDVVARLRRITGVRRIGHAGTLDPLATGVLVVCVGAATRLSEYLMAGDKRYRATLHLGIETDTWDADGQVVARTDACAVTAEQFCAACAGLVGQSEQTPPIYSAIKRNGQPLYRLARRGEQITADPRPVTIYAIEVLSFAPPLATIDVSCSKGTYIRSLAHDLGRGLGCGAYLAALRRERSGSMGLDTAVPLDVLSATNWREHLSSPWRALADWPRVTVTGERRAELLLGRAITLADVKADLCFAFDHTGELVAVLTPDATPGLMRPIKVLARA